MSVSAYDIFEYLLFKIALFGYSYWFICIPAGLIFSYMIFKAKKAALKILVMTPKGCNDVFQYMRQ
ncbi:hypothetical protein KKJ14_19370 [Xenorhabdus bovienii]